MTYYDYKVIPAPKRAKRVKGVHGRRGPVRADADRVDQRGGAPGLGVRPGRAPAGRGAARLVPRRPPRASRPCWSSAAPASRPARGSSPPPGPSRSPPSRPRPSRRARPRSRPPSTGWRSGCAASRRSGSSRCPAAPTSPRRSAPPPGSGRPTRADQPRAARELERQRVDAAGELGGERPVHGAAALDAAEPVEPRGAHHDAEVRAAALAPAAVAAVGLALVDHLEVVGVERLGQARPQGLRHPLARRRHPSSSPPPDVGLGPARSND